MAKSNCWNQFLEKAEGKEIFKAFIYTKQKRIKRLLIIIYSDRNNGRKDAIIFNQKCDAFLILLFYLPPASELPDWSSYIEKEWEWPEILIDEIKEAIFSSSGKKAPGSDQISFFIIQKVYNSIPEYFHHIYQNLIRLGYHPKYWKTAIGVILRKLGEKRNWSKPKSYRIISLLTCLGKIAEKIITARLIYLAETTDLLHFNQINKRRKKSAIDTVMTLIHNIQLTKQDKKVTSALFIGVKGAFDYISANQLIKICINLGLPKSLYSWIDSFLIDRKIQLAFDNGTSIETDIQIGIPQGSPISP